MLKTISVMCFLALPSIAYAAGNTQKPHSANSTVNITAKSYAYVTNYANYSVSACLVDPSNGSLSECKTNSLGTNNNYTLQGIAISGNQAYISVVSQDASSFRVVLCNVNGNTLNQCNTISEQSGRALSSTVLNGYFYAANNTQNFINFCTLSSGGSCATTGTNLSGPSSGVGFYTNGSTTYAYITNYSSSNTSVTMCTAASSGGAFENCQQLTTPTPYSSTALASPSAIVVSGSMAYIASQGASTILECAITDSGTFSTCTSFSDLTIINTPMGLGVYNGYLYINNNSASTVTNCAINSSGYLASPCHSNTSTSFNSPIANIAFS